jgi:glycerol uptake facilitator-like aquaporin
MRKTSLIEQLHLCEFLGSMFLVIAAVSPIILFTQVLGANIAIAVLADGIAVAFILFALIEIFGPICIAFFNPVVCFAMALNKSLTWKKALTLSINQIFGGLTGLLLVHLMFYQNIPTLLSISNITRSGGTYLSEIICTFILVLAVLSLTNQKSTKTSLVVSLLVGGMLIATSSTMFANPQVTIARMFTYSEAGISPIDGAIFILMQFIGATLASITWKKLRLFCCDYKSNCSNQN